MRQKTQKNHHLAKLLEQLMVAVVCPIARKYDFWRTKDDIFPHVLLEPVKV